MSQNLVMYHIKYFDKDRYLLTLLGKPSQSTGNTDPCMEVAPQPVIHLYCSLAYFSTSIAETRLLYIFLNHKLSEKTLTNKQCFTFPRRGALASITTPLVYYTLKHSNNLIIFSNHFENLSSIQNNLEKYVVLTRVKELSTFWLSNHVTTSEQKCEVNEKKYFFSYPMLSVYNV